MGAPVILEAVAGFETHVTLVTSIGPLTRMDPSVSNQVRTIVESLATVFTGIYLSLSENHLRALKFNAETAMVIFPGSNRLPFQRR